MIFVAPTPQTMRTITRALNPLLNNLIGHRLKVISPADFSEEVNEVSREVQPVIAQLGRLVVPGESVVVIVEAFAESEDGDGDVFSGADASVVGFATPFVGGGVDEPGDVEDESVAEHGGDEVGVGPGLAPEVDWDHGRHYEAGDRHQVQVVSGIEGERKMV